MMKKALLPFLVLFVAIAILLATGLGNREKFNIDVTMVVDTPNGRISQSSVVGYYSAAYPKRLHKNNYSTLRIFGSAPYAEISPEQYLFALNLYEPYNILKTYSDHYGLQNGIDQTLIKQIVSDKSRPKLKARVLPILARFKHLNEPSSIEQVQAPFLRSVFGNGTKLAAIHYQVTDKPVTLVEIRPILKWLSYHTGQFKPGTEIGADSDPNIAGFNRTVVYRDYSCLIDDFTMNNLTYGLWRKGINCRI